MVSLYVIYTALHLELCEEEQFLLFLSVMVVVDVAIFVEFLRVKFLVYFSVMFLLLFVLNLKKSTKLYLLFIV